MSVEEFQWLRTDEGRIQFIARHTNLDPDRVDRIDRLGQPWPLGLPDGLGQECVEDGIHPYKALIAMGPLIDLEIAEKEKQLQEFKAAIERGETPTSIPPELKNPEMLKHIESVAALSGEETDIVCRVFEGEIAYLFRLNDLVQEERESNRHASD